MKIYYALYDPSSSIDGNYWTWSASEIKPLLNRFYGDIATAHLPPNPNTLQDDDLWGGMVRLADWTVAYRYFNGGYDKQGRPGRYVLLTAWIPADDAHRANLLPVFDNAIFRHVSENAKNIPIPPLFALEERWVAKGISHIQAGDGKTQFTDLMQAMKAFASVSSHRKARFAIADVKIIKTTDEQKFVLNVVPEIKEQPEPLPPVQTPASKPAPKSSVSGGSVIQDDAKHRIKSESKLYFLKRTFAFIGIVCVFGVVIVGVKNPKNNKLKGQITNTENNFGTNEPKSNGVKNKLPDHEKPSNSDTNLNDGAESPNTDNTRPSGNIQDEQNTKNEFIKQVGKTAVIVVAISGVVYTIWHYLFKNTDAAQETQTKIRTRWQVNKPRETHVERVNF